MIGFFLKMATPISKRYLGKNVKWKENQLVTTLVPCLFQSYSIGSNPRPWVSRYCMYQTSRNRLLSKSQQHFESYSSLHPKSRIISQKLLTSASYFVGSQLPDPPGNVSSATSAASLKRSEFTQTETMEDCLGMSYSGGRSGSLSWYQNNPTPLKN